MDYVKNHARMWFFGHSNRLTQPLIIVCEDRHKHLMPSPEIIQQQDPLRPNTDGRISEIIHFPRMVGKRDWQLCMHQAA